MSSYNSNKFLAAIFVCILTLVAIVYISNIIFPNEPLDNNTITATSD